MIQQNKDTSLDETIAKVKKFLTKSNEDFLIKLVIGMSRFEFAAFLSVLFSEIEYITAMGRSQSKNSGA